jgi:hypothetical protein
MRTIIIVTTLIAAALANPIVEIIKRQDLCQAEPGDSCDSTGASSCCDSITFVTCDPQGEIFFDYCPDGENCINSGECVQSQS